VLYQKKIEIARPRLSTRCFAIRYVCALTRTRTVWRYPFTKQLL